MVIVKIPTNRICTEIDNRENRFRPWEHNQRNFIKTYTDEEFGINAINRK